MRRALRLTTALYPAMGVVLVLALVFSSRSPEGGRLVRDRVFPLLVLVHDPGSGVLPPGALALNFLGPSLGLMVAANVFVPRRVRALRAGRANLFWYILVLILAILDVGGAVVLPVVALPHRWAFPVAVTVVHAGFLLAIVVADVASRGAESEW